MPESEPIPDPTPPKSNFVPISFWRLASKELRETLRDRRTLFTLLLMPLIVYPILSLLFQGFIASGFDESKTTDQAAVAAANSSPPSQQADSQSPNPNLPVADAPPKHNEFVFVFNNEQSLNTLAPHLNRGFMNFKRVQNAHPDAEENVSEASLLSRHQLMWADSAKGLTVKNMVRDGIADVGVEISKVEFESGLMKPIDFTLYYVKEDQRSQEALRLFESILDSITIGSYRDVLIANRIRPLQPPIRFITESVSPLKSQKAGISFAALIPLILTLMTITGAVYPAIDLTAGERERGTLESMIAAPVPRMRILLGKLVAVVAVAMLTAILNLIGMSITLWVFQFDRALFGEQGLTLITVGRILGLLMLFAVFFSSILLVLTSFARSFKEGQAYLIPLMMVALAPSLMSLKPDLELAGLWTVTPLVNIVLLARDVLNGTANWSNSVVTVGTTILYSILAITMAARFFGTAKVLYGMDQGIGSLIRRPKEHRLVASASLAMLCLALLFPASFLWQGVMARTANVPEKIEKNFEGGSEASSDSFEYVPQSVVQRQLWMAALGLTLIFLVLPALLAAFHRVRLRSCFGLNMPSVLAIIAGVFMGIGFGPLLLQAIAMSATLLEQLGVSNEALQQSLVQRGEAHVQQIKAAPLWLVMLSMAIVPAVCEELFFRGMLFRAFRSTMSPWKTIVATALLFGAFHLISASGLTVSRLVPTTVMGIVLGWVCYRSGSVLPGILLHGIYNAMTVGFAYFRDDLVDRGWIVKEQSSVPSIALLIGVGCVVAGFVLLKVGRSPRDH